MDATAVRVALWRALHRQVDAEPWVLDDALAEPLAAIDARWHQRPDMHPVRTGRARASIVGRARFVEDHVAAQHALGVSQFVLLGAGLDSFAWRSPLLARGLTVFEVDQRGTLAWKRERLAALGIATPASMRAVPVDFETESSWWPRLLAAGFDATQPAVFSSLGVAMYLSPEAVAAMLRQLARAAPGSTLVLSFMRPLTEIDAEERAGRAATERYARAAGTPFLSLFSAGPLMALARDSGFRQVAHVSSPALHERYFARRSDGLRPSSSEELLVASLCTNSGPTT